MTMSCLAKFQEESKVERDFGTRFDFLKKGEETDKHGSPEAWIPGETKLRVEAVKDVGG